MKTRSLVALLAAGIGSSPSFALAQPVDAPDATEAPEGREAPDTDPPEDPPPAPSGEEEGEEVGEGDAPGREDTSAPDAEPTAPPPGAELTTPAPPATAPGTPAPAPGAPAAGPRLPEPQAPEPAPGIGLLPRPTADASALQAQGAARPKEQTPPEHPKDQVFAEDWWTHARPVFEIHGYFRLRAELFHNFSLGRYDPANQAIWPQPADNVYNPRRTGAGTVNNDPTVGPDLCTGDETSASNRDSDDPSEGLYPCKDKTQAGANLRFRLNPELHVSDNVRVVSQLDILDNVTLGSTPSGSYFQPAPDGGGYEALPRRTGYAPVGALDDTIVAPASGINSVDDAVRVKRVWGEYASPVGELRFGRMPNHWGLGMFHNAGDEYDDDYQSTIDRIQFITGLKPLDLYLGLSWDFPNEGPISDGLDKVGGQPYDLAQLDDVNQWSLMVMRNKSPQLTKTALAKGKLVFNVGAYVLLRQQLLANDPPRESADTGVSNVPGTPRDDIANSYSRRGANIWLPDVWLQLRYKKFRFEAEAAAVLGSIESLDNTGRTTISDDEELFLRQYGYAMEIEQLLIEDRLKLQFRHGWSTGDPDAFDPDTIGDLSSSPGQVQINDDTDSTFRFHPNYRVDLILYRYLLNRVEGSYYFRPDVEYDFMRKAGGQRFGGGVGFIWSRAMQPVQTPGHARDLGIELNGKLYFQSKDGALNDDPTNMGGFYTMLQYGVLFPLQGLGHQASYGGNADTSAAQIMRWYMGILF